MLTKLRKKTDGFTIIEVLIVLAIAGLILLIVFLAVPALQRNSRNTQRRNDVAAILGAVNEWSNNNSGAIPVTANIAEINSLAKIKQVTAPTAVFTGTQAAGFTIDETMLVTGGRCDGTTGNTTATGATNRSVAVRFNVEGSSGAVIKQCQEA